MATIRDVAIKAGVSLGTASQAISGRGKVSAKARTSVLVAAQELGYNYIERLPAKGHTIGLFMLNTPNDDVYEGFFGKIVCSITQAAEDKGYRVLVRSIQDPLSFARSISAPGERTGIDGAIIYPHHNTTLEFYDLLNNVKFPLVILGDSNPGFTSVSIDNEGAMALCIKHLAELGHRRIAYITHGGQIIDDRRRRSGFLSAAQSLNLESSVFTLEQLRAAIVASDRNLPFTAITCFDDSRALAVIKILTESGLKVPGDISVIGFGCYEEYLRIMPELTSIDHPVVEHAVSAFRLLSEMIKKERKYRTKLEMYCSLNPGQTVKSLC